VRRDIDESSNNLAERFQPKPLRIVCKQFGGRTWAVRGKHRLREARRSRNSLKIDIEEAGIISGFFVERMGKIYFV